MIRPYLLSKKDLAYDNVGFDIYDADSLAKLDNLNDNSTTEPSGDKEEENNDTPVEDGKEQTSENKEMNNYIGTLEIPKINLKKGFVSPSSKYNNSNFNNMY